jgi:hypothetical protein
MEVLVLGMPKTGTSCKAEISSPKLMGCRRQLEALVVLMKMKRESLMLTVVIVSSNEASTRRSWIFGRLSHDEHFDPKPARR